MIVKDVVFIVSLDDERCCGTRACLPVCNYGGLITVPGEKKPMIDPWSCTGCGACVSICPKRALNLIPR